MSVYSPTQQPWHFDVPGNCVCDAAWRDRGLVDDYCYWHRTIEAVEELRAAGWTIEPPR